MKNISSLADYQPRKFPRIPLGQGVNYSEADDALTIEQPDGGVIIQFSPRSNKPADDQDFYANIVDDIDPSVLSSIAWKLLEGIQTDDTSRTQWVSDRTRGLDLLAIKVEAPRSEVAGAAAPVEGMATVRHPLLLEACIRYQSNAKRELLPASGPLKVKNTGLGTAVNDNLADQLEEDLNRYLTEFAPEYYPDTDRMFFDVGFSGMGFKKVFHCPVRRRPVSETVPAKDLIVSNEATDLRSATRVTHQITMTKAQLKRMQFVGAYRDVQLMHPDMGAQNRITKKEGNVQGINKSTHRQEDIPYTIYESYTLWDIPGFEHKDESGEATGLPMPWKITVDKTSRQVLEVRRNWNEDDVETFEPRRVFVAYPFVPMFGFYATGLLHILGNTTAAVTGAWRILLDSGMFANFPGFLYAKSGARQDDLSFRVPPGGGAAVDIGGSDDIRNVVMPLPYKDPGTATMSLVDNMITTGQRVGGTAEMISADATSKNQPVGTTMALIEQAAVTVSAVHERNFVSQSQEFQMLLDLFREDPASLFRFLEKDGKWTLETLTAALEKYSLVPVADPNTPTHVHRIMKNTTLKQLQMATPQIYNAKAVDERILRAIKIDDPESLFAPPAPPGAAPPDPAVIIAQATERVKTAEIQAKAQIAQLETAHSGEMEQMKAKLKLLELQLKDKQAKEANETKITVAEIAAHEKASDRATTEHLAHLDLAKEVAHSPFEDDNHRKQLELKKAGPPKAPGAK
jgi:hypothetical protein